MGTTGHGLELDSIQVDVMRQAPLYHVPCMVQVHLFMKGFPHVEFQLSNFSCKLYIADMSHRQSDNKESMTRLLDFSTDHFHTPNILILFLYFISAGILGYCNTYRDRIIFYCCALSMNGPQLAWADLCINTRIRVNVIYNREELLIRTFTPARLPTRSCIKRHHKHGHDLVFFLPLILHREERNVRIWNEMLPNNHRLRATWTSIPSGDNSR